MSGFGNAGAVGSISATALERPAASNNRGTQVRTPTPKRDDVATCVSIVGCFWRPGNSVSNPAAGYQTPGASTATALVGTFVWVPAAHSYHLPSMRGAKSRIHTQCMCKQAEPVQLLRQGRADFLKTQSVCVSQLLDTRRM